MTRPTSTLLILLTVIAPAVAQTPPTDELVQDLRNQLRAAQDRKNELATENTKLRQQIADGEKKLTEQAQQFAAVDTRLYYLREHYAAWAAFLEINPTVRSMWTAFAASAEAVDRATELLGDGRWPFSIDG